MHDLTIGQHTPGAPQLAWTDRQNHVILAFNAFIYILSEMQLI